MGAELLPDGELQALAARDAGRWFAVSVGSIAVAGTFALLLVVARIPGVDEALLPDPEFFWRALIVHVNLALGVWFFGFLAGLFCLLPGVRRRRLTTPALLLGLVGILAFMSSMFLREATPIRSNYVPVLDHWLFLGGLGAFAAAISLVFADSRMFPDNRVYSVIPAEAQTGLRAAGIAFVTAMATLGVAWATRPEGLEPYAYYEGLFWGGGHVLQFVNVLGMVAAWLLLLSGALRRPVMGAGLASLLFLLLLLPALSGPWLQTLDDSRRWFTELMRWGIFPSVTLFLLVIIGGLWRARKRGELPRGFWRSLGFLGFATSAGMTVLGFLLGAMIRSDTTLVPAHYHMSIGAVTAAYMAALLMLLEPLGAPLRSARQQRVAAWQPAMFGGGQAIMAVGFAIAGIAGAERKAYAADQVVRGAGEWIGLAVMAGGGLLATVGGVIFLVVLLIAWRGRPAAT